MPSISPPSPQTIPLTCYLFTRLHQLGVRSLHGVPGDYNLTALDYVVPCELTWVGNCNELNAGYAADGYARIKGLGALITAFGVGELSAINAIGGSYAERAAVVHIVGTPPRAAQKGGVCLHHSFGDGNFRVFAQMAKSVTVAQANLVDELTACAEIDRVLRECLLRSRPVYIELPTDMVNVAVSSDRLKTPIDILPHPTAHQQQSLDEVVSYLLRRISTTTQPFIIVDGFCARYNIWAELEELVTLLGWPTSSTPFGKSCIDETLPNYHGIYAGLAGRSVYRPWVDSCDLVLRFGGLDSDVNTYGFSTLPPEKATINFHREHVVLGDTGKVVPALPIKRVLQSLLEGLRNMDSAGHMSKTSAYPTHLGNPRDELLSLPSVDPGSKIEQHDFWRRMSTFFREGDIILTETGTPSVGSREFILPKNARLVNSSIWLSIGYMLAASQGAALANREIRQSQPAKQSSAQSPATMAAPVLTPRTTSGRTILFEGDGSFQMTAQEVGTIIKHKLDLTLFLINNDGYTIERFIHGMHAHYNDVAPWRYRDAPRFFGAGMVTGTRNATADVNGVSDQVQNDDDDDDYPIITFQAHTWAELSHILSSDPLQRGKGFCMVEVMMDRHDAPDTLKKLVQSVQKRNSGSSLGEGEEPEREREREKERETEGEDHLPEKLVEEKVIKIAG